MKRSISALTALLGCLTSAWAAGPAPLTTLRAIKVLSNETANQHLPADFEATVTFYRGNEGTMFVQDEDAAIYVSPPRNVTLLPGDRVRIKGTTHADFSPSVVGETITVIRHGALPRPVPTTFDDLVRGRRDCMLVTVAAAIRTVDVQMRNDTRNSAAPMHPISRVQMLADGGYIEALVDGADGASLSDLLDSEVEVTGIASFNFDGKMQPTGVVLDVPGRADFKPVALARTDPWSLPATPMGRILSGYHVRDLSERIRVHGSITYYQPGSAVVIQDGTKSLWVSTMTRGNLRVGDIADAIGFPDAHDGHLGLARAEIKDSGIWAPIPPKPASVSELMASGDLFDLVSVEGEVAASVRRAAQDEYVLVNDHQIFTAIYRRSGPKSEAMKQIPVGSKVRAVGICRQEDSNHFIARLPFEILLRGSDDIAVIADPTPLNPRNLLLLIGFLLAGLFAVGARGWLVERRVRRQTAAMAYIEQRRSRILENIHSSRPLAAIIEEITELVSCMLKGAPCWCQIAGGAQLGNCPPKIAAFRLVDAEIPAHSGPALGVVFVALDPRTTPTAVESEALSMAAALAALAIETHRLYSDLLHRSEFDQLTNAHNRFSLDKYLDDLITGARNAAGLFGLVYVDLDRFKQINDLYGHHVGDLYLKEVAFRMKGQLRSVDTLARIGGDEFAALLPDVHSRGDVEEIALRLEKCFSDPFSIEGYTLHGSASVGIAVYPEDATNKDLLFRVADSAMYAAKHAKQHVETIVEA